MLPGDLKAEQFRAYPPQARRLVVDHLPILRRLPLSFVPSLLREAIAYDWKFPAERRRLEREFVSLRSLSVELSNTWFAAFSRIHLSSNLEHMDWVNGPGEFVEQLAAYLWTTHQVDAFRTAAVEYANRLHEASPPPEQPPRLGIAVVGQGVTNNRYVLFRKLRPHGVYFTRVKPENGLKQLIDAVAQRARTQPSLYDHLEFPF